MCVCVSVRVCVFVHLVVNVCTHLFMWVHKRECTYRDRRSTLNVSLGYSLHCYLRQDFSWNLEATNAVRLPGYYNLSIHLFLLHQSPKPLETWAYHVFLSVLKFAMWIKMASNSQRFACFCLTSTQLKSMCHQG